MSHTLAPWFSASTTFVNSRCSTSGPDTVGLLHTSKFRCLAEHTTARFAPFMAGYILICMHVCMHVCMHACMWCACMSECMRVYVYVCVCMYVCIHVCLFVRPSVCLSVCTYTYTICMYVCMYVCMHTRMHISTYLSLSLSLYIYIYIYPYVYRPRLSQQPSLVQACTYIRDQLNHTCWPIYHILVITQYLVYRG